MGTTEKVLDIVKDAGPFLKKVFGPLVEDAVGVVADRVKFYRLKNFLSLVDKVEHLLQARSIHTPRPVRPSFAIPLIEAATLEDDDSLQQCWANLLTNSMDPTVGEPPRTAFISILKDLSPIDAYVLSYLARHESMSGIGFASFLAGARSPFGVELFAKEIGQTPQNVEVALWNLSRVNCISMVHGVDGTVQYVTATIGESNVTRPFVTRLGRAFLRACNDGAKN